MILGLPPDIPLITCRRKANRLICNSDTCLGRMPVLQAPVVMIGTDSYTGMASTLESMKVLGSPPPPISPSIPPLPSHYTHFPHTISQSLLCTLALPSWPAAKICIDCYYRVGVGRLSERLKHRGWLRSR